MKNLQPVRKCCGFFLLLVSVLILAAFPSKCPADDGKQAVEVIPPPPTHYFNDYAGVVSTATASRLNSLLENHERETSDQIVVAVFQKMQSTSPVKEYTLRIANSWKVGQKGKNNGVSLFLFVQDHKLYVQVGTGLEKALPDATCQQILDTKIIPHLKKGDYDAALTAGVNALIAATNRTFRGNGQTAADSKSATTNTTSPAGKTSSP